MKHRIQTQSRFPIRSRSEAKSITECLLFGTDPAARRSPAEIPIVSGKLTARGLLKVVCGTEALGISVPIRTAMKANSKLL